MTDPDREKIVVEQEPRHVERETTVVSSGNGGGGAMLAVLVVAIVALLLFLYFGGYLGGGGDTTGINVNVDVPEVQAPDIDVNLPPPEQPSQPANSQ